jgi:tetratricopeptide (TPR) repeat protein
LNTADAMNGVPTPEQSAASSLATRHRPPATVLLAISLLILFLGACSAVEVSVEEPIAEPTATPFQRSTPAAQALSAGAADDDERIVRWAAYPHVVLAEDTNTLELFPQRMRPVEYMAYDTGYAYRLRVDWRSLWLEDVEGTARFTLETYIQPPGASEYEYWDYVSTEDQWGYGPDFRNELLDSTIWLPGPGHFKLRGVLTVSAAQPDVPGRTEQATLETDIYAFTKPADENIPASNEYFTPAFGDLETYGIFLDWRSWAFGPCSLSSGVESVTSLLDAACQSVENGDLESVKNALQEGLDQETDDVTKATLRGQLGVIAAVSGQWNIANRHFREALNLWQVNDRAVEAASSLHNLGITLVSLGRWEEGEAALQQADQLRNQIHDWRGVEFSAAQLAIYYNALDWMEYLVSRFWEQGYPQAQALQNWYDSKLAEAALTATPEGDS